MNNLFEYEELTNDLYLGKYEYLDNKKNHRELKSNIVGLIALGVGGVSKIQGKINLSIAKRKEAEVEIIKIGGKIQAEFKQCEKNKAFKKFGDLKYRKARINDCKNEVRKRFDVEEKEQKDIIKRMIAIEEDKKNVDIEKKELKLKEDKSGKKLYVIGGILALALVLGTIFYIKSRK